MAKKLWIIAILLIGSISLLAVSACSQSEAAGAR